MNIQSAIINILSLSRIKQKLYIGIGVALALAVGGAIVTSLVAAIPSSTGLVAHWNFDQSTGTVLTDDSGNGLNGTFGSTPTWTPGKINNSLKFDGSDFVQIGNIPQINGASKVTIATWMKRASAGAKVLVGKQATNQDLAIEAYSDGRIYFQASKGSDTYGYITLNDTNWHHVALVFDGTLSGNANRLKAYVDGVQRTLTFKGTVQTTTTTNTAPFYIGRVAGEYSNGQIDDTWLYARALSTAEVQDLAQVTADTAAPTVPADVTATPVSATQNNLAWTASTDNTAVTGYRVYRNGVERGTTTGTTYQDTGLVANTSYTYTVRAYDAVGNQSADSASASATTFPAPTVTLTAAPASVPSGGESTLAWTTANATACTASGNWSGAQPLNGSLVVSDIQAAKSYTLTCAGNGTQTAATATVAVLPACSDGLDNDADSFTDGTDPGCSSASDTDETDPDLVAPVVSLTDPSDGATVEGAITVSADASDNVAVSQVVFSVDGFQHGAADTSSPYGISLDTTTLTDGAHTIRAVATDAAGNSSSSQVNVTVDNPEPADVIAPSVGVSGPTGGATVNGTVNVTANASDNIGVAGVKFYAGSTQIGAEDTTAPYSVSWDTTSVADGTVQLTAVARDAAGNVTTSSAVSVTVRNTVAAGHRYVTGVSANGRYFTDQDGDPILIKGDSPWSPFCNLSAAQIEQWAANRESHGFNAAIVSLVGHTTNGCPSSNGATYDGVLPFVSGNITQFNEAYWSRMDTYMTIMKNHGITVMLYPIDGWTTLSGGAMYNKSNADSYTYGQKVAQRFASYPNIVWMSGGDYNGYDSTINAQVSNVLAGIRSTGDNRLFSMQLNSEVNSTDVAFYEPLTQWNFVYTYYATYVNVMKAYNRAPSARDPRPALFSEGNYEREDWYGGLPTTDETLRRAELWSLTSGSPGAFMGSEDWQFLSGWQNRLDTTWVQQADKFRSWFGSLAGWHQLVPDQTNSLVTAGRGTKLTSSGGVDVRSNDYVTAAQTPDKSLSVVYIPTNTGNTNARTITLNTANLPSNYTATWVDPTDATQSQPATIDGAGQVTTPGLHSDGTRDWLLVIKP